MSIPVKYSENKNNLKRFQELLCEYLADGELTSDEITNLKTFCQEKNIPLESALSHSILQINIFLRGMLASIISDGEVTLEEESMIKTACDFLNPSVLLIDEIHSTMERIRLISMVRTGNIPVISGCNFVANNNELVWYASDEVRLIRELSQKTKTYRGYVIVSSERVIFKSRNHPVEMKLKNIIDVEYNASHLYVVSKSKSKTCQFRLDNAEVLGAYIEQALAKFHRKLNFQQGTKKSRVISQNIKQAVWLRDAGQCVECEATEYLEFDHIIPFSKGGANSESNIQLLCRKCNLKKSDKI